MELPPMDMPAATTVDRRLIENPDIPAGPPGAEADHEDFVHRPGPPSHPELQDQQQQHHHQQQQLAAESPAHTSKSSTRDRDPRVVKSRRSSRSPSPSSSSRHRRRGGGSSNRRSTSSSPDRRRGRSDRGRGGGGYDDRSRGGQRRRSRSRDRIRSPLPVRRTRRSRDRSLSPIRHGGGGIGGGRYQHRSPDRNDRYRGGGRRSRSRSLSPRRSASRRGGGGGWSPMAGSGKKGPVSPPPLLPTPSDRAAMLQQQQQQSAMQASQQQQQSYQPMPMYHGGLPPDAGYNQYGPPPGGMAYGQADAYGVGGGGYADYGMQQGPPPGPPPGFNAYAPPQVMQPVVQQVDWNRPPEVHVAPVVMQPHPQQLQQQQQQHPPTPPPPVRTAEEEKQKRDAAIEQEKKNQRATLRKQRDDYKRRSTALKHELNLLRDQHDDLETFAEPPSPTTKGFLKENHRLQMQIENKIATIENVIDMLSGMIGPDKSPSPSPPPPPPVVAVDKKAKRMDEDEADDDDDDDDSSPERLKTKALQSLKRNKSEKVEASSMAEPSAPGTYEVKPPEQQVNFVHYDPEMHWCQTCQVFPKTAKDFLTHLHSKDHQEMQKTIESPWHDHPLNDEMPNYPNAPTKRTPIRGLQFFVPTTGWYCRICDVWMGDLHCASLHLKSKTHARQYHDYAAQNPSFEVDWMSDRQRAYEQKREEAAEAAAAAAAAAAANVQPPPPPSLSEHALIGGGIPLQIPVSSHKPSSAPSVDAVSTAVGIAASVVMAAADDAAKKRAAKKRKKEERREKKKKKRSRKHRKHRSSSSSSNSDSSNSDNDCNDTSSTVGGGSRSAATPTADASATSHADGRQPHSTGMEQPHDSAAAGSSHSIRVAMRNLLQQQSELQQLQEQRAAQQTPPTSTAGATAVDSSATAGRWTVVQTPTAIATSAMTTVPPPPTISANGAEANRKDELMIAQWNEPQAVISEKEKQLLEELKGRLKKRSPERPEKVVPAVQTGPPTVAEKKRGAASPDMGRGGGDRRRAAHSRSRSRERSSGGYHRGRGGRSRSRGRRVSRSRSRGRRGSRSRSRGRRISRSRSRSRSGGRYAGSNVRSTRRTRSRSRTRMSRVEKPIVRYPEFRPRVPETDKDATAGKKQRGDGDSAADRRSDKDKKVAMVLKKGGSGASGGSGAQVKKLPFIGRMPVFKKQTNDEEQRRDEEQQQQQTAAAAVKAQAEQQQQLQQQHQQQQQLHHHQHPYMHHPQHHMYHHHQHHYDGMHQMAAEDYDNLMPDPMQFVSMMGAPPPPPMVPPPPPPPVQQQQHIDTEPVLPPGIDAADADQVIKPISDAPLPRKGPLPQDFQDALSIIFPGERRPDEVGDGAPGAATATAVDAEAGVDAMATTTVGNSLSADASDGSSDAVHQHLSMLEPSPEAIISAPPISAAEAQETAVAQAQAAAAEAAALRDEQKSQHSIDLYSAFSVVNGVAVLNTELAGIVVGGEVAHMGAFAASDDATAIGCGEVPLPPPPNGVAMLGGDGFDAENGAGTDSNSRDEELKAARLEELNDMAMLGIDADDLAAQCM